MKLKNSVFVLIGITLSSIALANAPTKCPSAAAIQSGGFDEIRYNPAYGYAVMKKGSTYDTAETWGFAFGFFDASLSEEAATHRAQADLLKISGTPKPMYSHGSWLCRYRTTGSEAKIAMTLTPVPEGNIVNFMK